MHLYTFNVQNIRHVFFGQILLRTQRFEPHDDMSAIIAADQSVQTLDFIVERGSLAQLTFAVVESVKEIKVVKSNLSGSIVTPT